MAEDKPKPHVWLKKLLARLLGTSTKARTAAPPRGRRECGQGLALEAAVAAIYFADSADYERALWTVVRALDPDVSKLLELDPKRAFDLTRTVQT